MTREEQLAALKAAYYSGHRSVYLGDQRVEYQSMADMWVAIQRLEAEIASTRPPVIGAIPTMYNRGRR